MCTYSLTVRSHITYIRTAFSLQAMSAARLYFMQARRVKINSVNVPTIPYMAAVAMCGLAG